MRILLAVALVAMASVAVADAGILRLQTKDMTVVLHKTPCTDAASLSIIQPEMRPRFFAADLTWKGTPLKACWAPLPDRAEVLMVDETGDYGMLPMSGFKPVRAM